MGSYVSVRGWLECDEFQLPVVKQIISAHQSYYSGGWALPATMYNGCFVFYGATLRVQSLDGLLDRLRAIAAIPASDPDDDRVTGLFLLSSSSTTGMTELQIRDGRIFTETASDRYRYLDE